MVRTKAKFTLDVRQYPPASFLNFHSQLTFFSFTSFYMCYQTLEWKTVLGSNKNFISYERKKDRMKVRGKKKERQRRTKRHRKTEREN